MGVPARCLPGWSCSDAALPGGTRHNALADTSIVRLAAGLDRTGIGGVDPAYGKGSGSLGTHECGDAAGNEHRQPGDHMIVTFCLGELPFLVMPVTVVADRPDRIMHYLAPGTRFLRRVLRDGSPVPRVIAVDELLERGSCLQPAIWQGSHRLIVTQPDAAHAVYLRWRDPDWTFQGWYVNLQEPLQRTGEGFTTQDHFLDIVVDPDRSWHWKDEDELDLAIKFGRITPDEAKEIRREGESIVHDVGERRFPFDGSLNIWRPNPDWKIPDMVSTDERAW